MNFIDHFSINVVPKNKGMLIFSIAPEIAYTLYSTAEGVRQDHAISPTFYENLDFYFWDSCYNPEVRKEIMQKKEIRFGIKSGAVITYEDEYARYLFSFGTKSNKDNFMQDITISREYYKQIALDCKEQMKEVLEKYINHEQNTGKIFYFKNYKN